MFILLNLKTYLSRIRIQSDPAIFGIRIRILTTGSADPDQKKIDLNRNTAVKGRDFLLLLFLQIFLFHAWYQKQASNI